MSTPVGKPCFVAGSVRNSGDVACGEVYVTRGGGRTASVYSGALTGAGLGAAPGAVAAGADVFFFSGAGRLCTIIPHVGLQSGQGVTFYDTALAASGGPIPTSGHKVLARLAATAEWSNLGTNSGQILIVGPQIVDAPFQSGLACRASSGCPGFTVTFSTEGIQ